MLTMASKPRSQVKRETSFGKKLTEARLSHGLSQKKLAKHLGMSLRSIASCERGEKVSDRLRRLVQLWIDGKID